MNANVTSHNQTMGFCQWFHLFTTKNLSTWNKSTLHDYGRSPHQRYFTQGWNQVQDPHLNNGRLMNKMGRIRTGSDSKFYNPCHPIWHHWLCPYPSPPEVGHDDGKEFMDGEFQEIVISYGISNKPTTIKNPTPPLVECLQLTLGNQFCVPIYFINNWHKDANHLIQASTWAVRTTSPSSLPYKPSQLTFWMDWF